MNHIIQNHEKLNRYLFIFIFFGVVLNNCSSPSDPKDKPKSKEYCTATITQNGKTFSFSADNITVVSAQNNLLGIGFLDTEKAVYIYLAAQNFKGIKAGDYSMASDAPSSGLYSYLTLKQLNRSDLLPEGYDTRHTSPLPHGMGLLTLTSVNGDRIEGTFSATLYSDTGSPAKVTDGKFIVIDKDFVF